jgi:hypothetical protein
MNDNRHTSTSTVNEGQLLRLREGHQVAIYKRDGVNWVAEFRNGRSELFDAAWWFYFHLGSLRYSHGIREAALDSATAITPEILAKIERLHRRVERVAHPRFATVAFNAVRRYWRSIGRPVSQ